VLKKDDMVKKNMMQHVMAERSIMAKSSNPFIVKLSYAFQSKVPLCILSSCPLHEWACSL
jgi:serine/threonine protein kinase